MIREFYHAAVAAMLLCCTMAMAADRMVQPGQSIQSAVNVAADGDVIILGDGNYAGPVDFGAKAVTLKATSRGKATITGGRITGGRAVKLDGFVFAGGSGNYMVGAIQVGAGSDIGFVEVRDAEGSGVYLNSSTVLHDSRITGSGYVGVEGWPAEQFADGQVRNCVIELNNCGRAVKPSWADRVEGGTWFGVAKDFQLRLVDGKLQPVKDGRTYWYGHPGWHAGGLKFGFTKNGLRIENNIVRYNGGCGIWLDCYITNATVGGNEVYGEKGINATWEGIGAWEEICNGGNTWTGNYFHDNEGGGLGLMETAGSTVKGNTFANNGIGFRDGGWGNPPQRVGMLKNIQISDNLFYGPQASANIAAAPAGRQIFLSGNKIGLTPPAQWTGPGTTPPPAPIVVPAESADGTRITPGSGQIINAASMTWTLRTDGRLYLDGVWDGQSNAVTEAIYRNHKLYQKGNGIWWVRDGSGWRQQDPPPPATVPAPPVRVIEIKNLGGVWKVQLRYSDGTLEIKEIPIP